MKGEKFLYAAGYAFYQQCDYRAAAQVFLKLATTSPFQEKYWRGLASSHQMLREYRAALKAWSVTACLCDEDPSPHFHAAECLLSLREYREGIKALECADERIDENTLFLKGKIELLTEAARNRQ